MRNRKQNRKFFCLTVLAVLLILTCLSGCGKTEPPEERLTRKGLEAAARLKEAVCNDKFQEITSKLTDSKLHEIVQKEDVTAAKAVYELTMDPLQAGWELLDNWEPLDTLPEYLKSQIIDEMYILLKMKNYQNSGWEDWHTCLQIQQNESFLLDLPAGHRYLVFVFESGVPVAVDFKTEGNGIVLASANWLIADCAAISSEESLLRELNLGEIPTLRAKKLP